MNHVWKTFAVILVIIVSSCSSEEVDLYEIEEDEIFSVLKEQAEEVMDLSNEYRAEVMGLNTLEFNEDAYNTALEHSIYMATSKKLTHGDFVSRAKKLSKKVNAITISENIAGKYDTAGETFEGWLESEGHYANIVGDYTHMAVAAVMNSSGDVYYTQIFYKANIDN